MDTQQERITILDRQNNDRPLTAVVFTADIRPFTAYPVNFGQMLDSWTDQTPQEVNIFFIPIGLQ